MADPSYSAPPRLQVPYIRNVAEQLRKVMSIPECSKFPIMEILEKRLDEDLNLIRLEVWAPEAMGQFDGLTFRDVHSVDRVILSERVYADAWNGQWKGRRIAAHELGHWMLHHSSCCWGGSARRRSSLRSSPAAANDSFDPIMETEADIFAIELLMPMEAIRVGDTALDLSIRFGAPRSLAEARLQAAQVVWRKKKAAEKELGGFSSLVTG